MILADDRTTLISQHLLALLREHLDEPALVFDGVPARLTGGFWAELVSFRVTPAPTDWDRDLVARVMPDPATAAKEGAFQFEVAAQGYPTPIVRLQRGPEAGVDGQAVMIMDRADGAPLLAGLDGLAALTKLPLLARRLPIVLADVLAQLHRLPPGPVTTRLAASDAPRPDVDSMLANLRSTAERLERPALLAAAQWLADHRPPTETDVLCHGDLHPLNVLIDDDDQLSVLDWSAAVVAPRTYDLGFTSLMLAEPPLEAPRALRPLIRLAGRALSRRFIKAYERQATVRIPTPTLRWYQGLICVRALTEVANWSVAGDLGERRGHPWVINEQALIARLRRVTGVTVAEETPRS